MHLHGHDFFLIAQGEGTFNDSVLQTAQLINPIRRDVVTMPSSPPKSDVKGGFVVLAFQLDNPGVWVRRLKAITKIYRLFTATLAFIYLWD